MAISSSSASPKGVVVTVPVLVLAASVAAVFLFFLLSSLSSCSCPGACVGVGVGVGVPVSGGGGVSVSTRKEDVEWVKEQIRVNGLHMQDNVLRKGINPRTRAQQLQDLSESVVSLSLTLCVYVWVVL